MKSRLALALAVILIGAIPVALGGWLIAERVSWSHSGRVVLAEVVDSERLWLRDLLSPLPRTNYYEVSYVFPAPSGDSVHGSGTYAQGRHISAPSPGTRLRVYYDPADPSSNVPVNDNRVFEALMLIGFGVFVWICGATAARVQYRSSQRLRHRT
jgi:hypothetical protein